MGSNLCCLNQKDSEIHQPNTKNNTSTLLHQEKSLHQCFLDSPNYINNPKTTTKRIYVSSPCHEVNNSNFYTPRISFSSPEAMMNKDLFGTPRISFSERVRKMEEINIIGEEKEEEEEEERLMNRTQSGKLKKKVTFKLPQEDDIIIFCSPTKSFEE